MGSISGFLSLPRLIPYGATKAFLRQVSGSLANDELFHAARPPNVSYLHMDVGSVASASHNFPPSLTTPTAEAFARRLVHCIGCGQACVAPYWVHALQIWFMGLIPDGLARYAAFPAIEEEIAASKKD